jgi:hypothetical protein
LQNLIIRELIKKIPNEAHFAVPMSHIFPLLNVQYRNKQKIITLQVDETCCAQTSKWKLSI